MAKETTKITGASIDAFVKYRPGMLQTCAMKGCRNSARVLVYFKMPGMTSQDRAGICQGCALDLANQSIGHHKFKTNN